MSDLVDVTVAELEKRDVVYIKDVDHLEDEFLVPLGHVLAWAAAPEFGAAADASLAALATQGELRLRQMDSTDYTRKLLEADYL